MAPYEPMSPMDPYESDDRTSTGKAQADDMRAGRRKATRYVVPVAVVGVAAATIGLVPALADSGDPNLPKHHRTATHREDRRVGRPAAVRHGQDQHRPRAARPGRSGERLHVRRRHRVTTAPPRTRSPSSWSWPPARTRCASRPTARTRARSPSWTAPPSTASSATATTYGRTTASRTRCTTRPPPESEGAEGEGAEGCPGHAQGTRRRGPEGGRRHDLRDRRRHRADRGP